MSNSSYSPHSRYTHDVIELTDGRCYCLACDEVVPERSLDGRGAESTSARPTPARPSATGD